MLVNINDSFQSINFSYEWRHNSLINLGQYAQLMGVSNQLISPTSGDITVDLRPVSL